MTEKLILEDLSAGKLENIDRFILEYLSPIQKTSDCTKDQLSRYTLVTVQVLQASVTHISTCGLHRSMLLNAVHICYNFYTKNRDVLKLPDPLTLPKVLYHIVAKLTEIKDCSNEIYKTCQYLYDELLPLPDHSTGATASIITNIYSKLWNVAIKLEQDKATQQPDVVLQLRYMAIKMLLLRRTALAPTVDKFLLAVDRYDKSSVQKNMKTAISEQHIAVKFVLDIAQYIETMGSDKCVVTESEVCSSLSLFQYLHQVIVTQQLHSILGTVHQNMQKFLSTFTNATFCKAVKNLYETLHLTLLCSINHKNSKTSRKDIQSLSGKIIDLLQDSISSLNTGWYLLICECLLVILKQQTMVSSEDQCFTEAILEYTQKVTQFLITSREEDKLQYEEDTKEKNDKLAGMISTKLIIIIRTVLELGVTLINHQKDSGRVSCVLQSLQPLTEAYTQQIEQTRHAPPSADFILRERRQCGYLMSKFAKVSCSLGHQELDLFYYSVECDQLTKWAESDENLKEQRIKEVNLLGIYEMLADLHWKLGDIDAVLQKLTKSVELQPSHLATAVEFWCRIKRQQLRVENVQIIDMYFVDNMKEFSETVDAYNILKMELKCLSLASKKYPGAELSLLRRIQQAAKHAVQKAEALLEIAKLVWERFTEKQERPVQEYLSDAEQLLESINTPDEMLILADVQLWTFVVKHENICKQLITSSQKMTKMEESIVDNGDEPQNWSAFEFDMMCTFSMEMEIIRHLDNAMELWEKVPPSVHTVNSIRSLMLCSSILRLTRKSEKEQHVLFLALQVCDKLGDETTCNVIKCRLSHIYGLHGMHHHASQILPSIPDQQNSFDDSYLQTVMASVMHYLHTKQIQKGLELLHSLNEKIKEQPSLSKNVCLANGIVKRYWSLFSSLPTDQSLEELSEEYSLDHAIEAYRYHVSVIYFLLGKEKWTVDTKGMNTTEKFDVIQEYLLSLYHLGQLERLVGDTRSAKFHIKEGWTTAHFMGLPKWASMFMIEFSMIHVLAENFEAATSSLTKTRQVFNACQEPADASLKDSRSKCTRVKRIESFGFDEVKKEEDQDTFLCSFPPCWQHLIDNVTCDLCEDDTVKLAILSYSLITAKFNVYVQQNLKFDILDKINNVCETFINQKPRNVKQGLKELPMCVFQDDSELKDIYVECLSLIAETSLLVGKTDKCESVIQSAQDLFQNQCVNDFVANLIQNKFTVFKAQMYLMRSLTSKKDSIEGDIDILEDVAPMEISITPEEISPLKISNKPVEGNQSVVTKEDHQELVEDIEKLEIKDVRGEQTNQSKAGTKTSKRRGATQRKQAKDDVCEASIETEKVVKSEAEITKRSAAGTRRKKISAKSVNQSTTKSVNQCTTKSVNQSTTKSLNQSTTKSLKQSTTTSLNQSTTKRDRKQGNTNGSLTEDLTVTSVSSTPEFVLKTPYSVCSKKALVFSSDSEEEIGSQLPISKSSDSFVTPSNPGSCSSANSTPATGKSNLKSRIPKYINRSRVSKTQRDSSASKGKKSSTQVDVTLETSTSRDKKSKEQDCVVQEDKENFPKKKSISRRGKTAANGELTKTNDVEPAKTSARGRRKATKTQVQSDSSNSGEISQAKDDIYDFVEGDPIDSGKSKTVRKTTRRTNARVKRQPAEKVRSAVAEINDETVDLIGHLGYCDIDEGTSPSDEDQSWTQDVQISKPELIDDKCLEEMLLKLEKAQVLDDSIEIPRGGDEKKMGRGQGKRVTKSSKQDTTERMEQSLGEDNTEIPRSTTRVNMQLTMERMRRAAPPGKVAKDARKADSPRDEDLTGMLEVAFEQARHLPTTGLYTSICNLLALQYIDTCPLKAAYYLTEGMVVTFRHQSLVNCSRKIRKCKKETTSDSDPNEMSGVQEGEIKNAIYKNLMFNKSAQDLQKILGDLPEDWTVCQVSMVTNPQVPDQMLLNSMRKDQDPVIVKLPAFKTVHGRRILSEFTDIMEQSHSSIKITDKTEWWQNRWNLDDRLRYVLQHMDKYWLGHWRCLIHGTVSSAVSGISIADVTKNLCEEIYKEIKVRLPQNIMQRLVECEDTLSDEDFKSVIYELSEKMSSSGVDNCLSSFRKYTKDLNLNSSQGHVFLILDKSVQHLPWESVPSLASTSISRMPSLYHLHSQLTYLNSQKSSILHTGIDKQSVFYVLNPDSNLASTQETFQDWFSKQKSWEGIINRKPTEAEYTQALQNKNLFLYCGHGTGGVYLGGSDLASLDCRAATILMGCSSGRLKATGHLEASGFMLNYFMAGCPCMVANLWDVTDKDIDRFLACLLSSWLSDEASTDPRSLLEVIPKARVACRLPHLIGAAPVVYGFPVFLKPS
ncbi:uncharacterized protein LOC133189955 [Saccostrea echinata]|uniref:uncharacterized protein LOC133189955 n=1 Tax=Saccostrea echinata TaxID=191078 RepID=UPI002A7FDA88|nr:uncharacterized protein LOC133189955 [Saccostrea echinata]